LLELERGTVAVHDLTTISAPAKCLS
jgi:hypothetical protein